MMLSDFILLECRDPLNEIWNFLKKKNFSGTRLSSGNWFLKVPRFCTWNSSRKVQSCLPIQKQLEKFTTKMWNVLLVPLLSLLWSLQLYLYCSNAASVNMEWSFIWSRPHLITTMRIQICEIIHVMSIVSIGFCDQSPSERLRSLNTEWSLKQESGYSDQVVAKARVWV